MHYALHHLRLTHHLVQVASPRRLILTSPLLTRPKKLFSMSPSSVMTLTIWYWCSHPYSLPDYMNFQGWDYTLPILVPLGINPASDAKRVMHSCDFNKHTSSVMLAKAYQALRKRELHFLLWWSLHHVLLERNTQLFHLLCVRVTWNMTFLNLK